LNLTLREDVQFGHEDKRDDEVLMITLKIGEIAERVGVSVRTLHYYEEIGLLMPTDRTAAGHRLYGAAAIERLQQIRSLQHLGLNLSEIDALLRGTTISPQRLVADHLASVQQKREALDNLEQQLRRLARVLEENPRDEIKAVETFLATMEAMTMYEKYLTPEQLQQTKDQHTAAGEAATKEWNATLDALRAEMAAGTQPDDPKVTALVERWHKAAEPFMPSGDQSLHDNVMRALHEEPKALEDHGLDPELFSYIGRALAPNEHEA